MASNGDFPIDILSTMDNDLIPDDLPCKPNIDINVENKLPEIVDNNISLVDEQHSDNVLHTPEAISDKLADLDTPESLPELDIDEMYDSESKICAITENVVSPTAENNLATADAIIDTDVSDTIENNTKESINEQLIKDKIISKDNEFNKFENDATSSGKSNIHIYKNDRASKLANSTLDISIEEGECSTSEESEYSSISDESSGDDVNCERCPICLMRLTGGQSLGNPEGCDHLFCLECLEEWSKKVNTCPVDRLTFGIIFERNVPGGDIVQRIDVAEVNTQEEEQVEEELTYCEVCQLANREDCLLLCDGCDSGYHYDCLTPALDRVPLGDWFCSNCRSRVSSSQSQTSVINLAENTTMSTVHQSIVPRTLQSVRVRAAIQRVRLRRIVSDSVPSDSALSGSAISEIFPGEDLSINYPANPKRTLTKRHRIRKRKKTRKLRKSRHRKKISKRRKPSTVKTRLASRLGISKPRVGQIIRKKSISETAKEKAIAILRGDLPSDMSLCVMANRNTLDPSFSDNEAKVGQLTLSQAAQKYRRPITASTDVLGDILACQNSLHNNTIFDKGKDGSLKTVNAVEKREKFNTISKDKKKKLYRKQNSDLNSPEQSFPLEKSPDVNEKSKSKSRKDKTSDHHPRKHKRSKLSKSDDKNESLNKGYSKTSKHSDKYSDRHKERNNDRHSDRHREGHRTMSDDRHRHRNSPDDRHRDRHRMNTKDNVSWSRRDDSRDRRQDSSHKRDNRRSHSRGKTHFSKNVADNHDKYDTSRRREYDRKVESRRNSDRWFDMDEDETEDSSQHYRYDRRSTYQRNNRRYDRRREKSNDRSRSSYTSKRKNISSPQHYRGTLRDVISSHRSKNYHSNEDVIIIDSPPPESQGQSIFNEEDYPKYDKPRLEHISPVRPVVKKPDPLTPLSLQPLINDTISQLARPTLAPFTPPTLAQMTVPKHSQCKKSSLSSESSLPASPKKVNGDEIDDLNIDYNSSTLPILSDALKAIQDKINNSSKMLSNTDDSKDSFLEEQVATNNQSNTLSTDDSSNKKITQVSNSLQNTEKIQPENKIMRKERIIDLVKLSLKPYYTEKRITKEEYKDIMRKCVPKVAATNQVNETKIQKLVIAYVEKTFKLKKHETRKLKK